MRSRMIDKDFRLHRRGIRYIIGNGAAMLVGLLACYAALFWRTGANVIGWDYFFSYTYSRMVVTGAGKLIYDSAVVGHLERALAYPVEVPHGVILNIYPTFYAVALAPLALLPYTLSYFVWLALDCFLLAGALYFVEDFAMLSRRNALILRVAAVLSFPVLVALLQGQPTLLILALLIIGFSALRAGHEVVAGAALAVTLIKPQYAPAFLLLLLVRRHYRALGGFAMAACCLFIIPVPILGLSTIPQYLRALVTASHWGRHDVGFDPSLNRGFWGLTQLLMPSPASTAVAVVLSLAAILVLGYCALRSASVDIPFAIAVTVALLISPHVLIHDLSFLLIPVAVALRYREAGPRSLIRVLVGCDLAITIGFGLSYAVPVQLSVFAMCGLGLWLIRAGSTASRANHGDIDTRSAKLRIVRTA